MLLIIGLGNPGSKYANTRHNVGFMFLDYLAERCGVSFKEGRWEAETARLATESGGGWLLAKPTTYMNLSGRPVARLASYHQIEPARIIVVHDDLDLEPGRLKVVFDRGSGGHNGIKSIIEQLGTRQFVRLRVGIGRPPEFMTPADFVLSRFSTAERAMLADGFVEMTNLVELVERQGVAAAMNNYNRRG